MRNLLLADLLLGLNDLLVNRVTTLRSSAAGRLYEPRLVSQRDAIQALPEPLRVVEPLAEDLGAMDVRHDSFGGAVYFVTEAYIRLEAYEPELARRARAVREAFVPSLAELRATYPTEAAAAIRRAPKLEAMKAELEAFPVLGGTLYTWVKEHIEAGKRLDQLTSERASVRAETASDRGSAGTLRSATIGLLGRAQAAMADELAANATLPRNLVEQTFGYFDELSLTRAGKTKPAKPTGKTPVEGLSRPPRVHPQSNGKLRQRLRSCRSSLRVELHRWASTVLGDSSSVSPIGWRNDVRERPEGSPADGLGDRQPWHARRCAPMSVTPARSPRKPMCPPSRHVTNLHAADPSGSEPSLLAASRPNPDPRAHHGVGQRVHTHRPAWHRLAGDVEPKWTDVAADKATI